MGTGEMKTPVDILEFVETKHNVYEWRAVAKAWAKVERQAQNSIYSKYGVTAKSVKLTMRKHSGLTQHNALSTAGYGHLAISDIDRDAPGFFVLSAAMVEPVTCKAERTQTVMGQNNRPVIEALTPLVFPGYLTEKYLRQVQEEPMSYSESRYILVTPKPIVLKTGVLVYAGGFPCEVVIPHELDMYRNEYEIIRRFDN